MIILVFFVSCGGPKESPRKLEVSFGALSATQPTMIYGQRLDGPEKFARKIDSSTITLPLPDGLWSFQAIYWDSGGKYMQNDPFCGHTQIQLTDSISTISLAMSKLNCTTNKWMGSYQHSMSSSIYFYLFELNLCPAGTPYSTLNSFASCSYHAAGATGLTIEIPEYDGSVINPTKKLTTGCEVFSPATNNPSFNYKFPFGIEANFPMYSVIKVFYADSSCTTDACCTGFSQEYKFPNGFGNPAIGMTTASPTNGAARKLHLEQKPGKYLALDISTIPYDSAACTLAHLEMKDETNTVITSAGAMNASVSCTRCQIFTDDACGTAVSSVPFAAAVGSTSVYIKATGAGAKLQASIPTDSTIQPLNKQFHVSATYANIDQAFLTSLPLGQISTVSVYGPNVFVDGGIIIYRTRQNNFGKMLINTYNSSTKVLDFNFETYGTANVNDVGLTVTACNDPTCNLDFDASNPTAANGSPDTDIWFQDWGGGIGWNWQASEFYLYTP